jgi:hypothetical protein
MNGNLAVVLWPLLVCILGALVYALASNPKASEMGRIAYFVGLLWTVYDIATRVVRF